MLLRGKPGSNELEQFDTLLTSILTAKLANSALDREDTARETSFAEKAIPSIEGLHTW